MSTGAGNVRELGEDLTGILNSFASMLEGVYYVDEALAESLANKFSDKLRTEVRIVYADMAKDIAEALAKPPVKRRKRKKKVSDEVLETTTMSDLERRQAQQAAIATERGVGVEELEDNDETSLLQKEALGQVADENDLASRLENAMNSKMPTDRAARASQSSNWDTDNPTMRPLRGKE